MDILRRTMSIEEYEKEKASGAVSEKDILQVELQKDIRDLINKYSGKELDFSIVSISLVTSAFAVLWHAVEGRESEERIKYLCFKLCEDSFKVISETKASEKIRKEIKENLKKSQKAYHKRKENKQ